jgi:hypothetical protein
MTVPSLGGIAHSIAEFLRWMGKPLAFLIFVIEPKFELFACNPLFVPNFVFDCIGNDLGQVRRRWRERRECRGFSILAAHANLDIEVAESKIKNLIRGDVHKFYRLSGASIASCP